MEVIIAKNADEGSLLAARIIRKLVQTKPEAVLGLATGNTPLKTYSALVKFHKTEQLNFSKVTTFNLDEYLGLGRTHPASYNSFMRENFFKHINIDEKNVHIPDGSTEVVQEHCDNYERKIKAVGGIDLQLLGIGENGHIGFNEPSSSLASRTRIKTLTGETRTTNSKFFSNPEEIPRHIITMGIGTIMEAKSIVLLAFGENKAEAVSCTVEGPITAMVPASILQMHERATIIVDEAAASKLQRINYYRQVYSFKPEWQRF